MLKSAPSRRGRPTAVYYPKIGDPVVGLMKLGDGRWRASGPEKYTFTEADEALAVAHFRAWQAKKTVSNLGTVRMHTSAEAAMIDLARRTIKADGSLHANVTHADDTSKTWAVSDDHLSPAQWQWLRRQIIDRPKWVSARAGLPKLAFIDITEKKPLPTLKALRQIWNKHFNSSPEQKRKCPIAFDDFCAVATINELEDITPEAVVRYRDAVYAKNTTGKTQSNHFTRIRRYLAFFRDRAIAIDDLTRLIGYLALLTPNESTVSLDPQPIDVAD